MTIKACAFAALISYIKEQLAGGRQVVIDQLSRALTLLTHTLSIVGFYIWCPVRMMIVIPPEIDILVIIIFVQF